VKNLLTLFRPVTTVKLAMEPRVLAALLEKGELHATDFRCLDLSSKRIVWELLLLQLKTRMDAFAKTRSPQAF